MELRAYQKNCLKRCLENREGGLCELPTGAGKSHIIAALCHALKDKSILVLTPRIELMRQNREKIGDREHTTCVTVHSAYKRQLKADILIIDECHLMQPTDGMYQTIAKNCKVIYGFTATPYRLNGGHIVGLTFDKCIFKIKRETLVKQGYLTPRHYLKPPNELLLNVKNDSFSSSKKLSDDVCPQSKACIEHYLSIRKNKQALIFACDIRHGLEIQKILPQSMLIHSKLPKHERDTLIKHFKTGILNHLINCEILTTGFDYPQLSEIVILRPTDSFVLYEQICGRGDRVYKNKSNNNIYDYTLNHYYFKKSEKRKNHIKFCIFCLKETDYRLKECSFCHKTLIKGEAPNRKCQHCKITNYSKATYCIECGAFIRKNTQSIKFDQINYKHLNYDKYYLTFGTSNVKFYTKKEDLNGFIGRFKGKTIYDDRIELEKKYIAFYRYDTYEKKTILLEVRLDK